MKEMYIVKENKNDHKIHKKNTTLMMVSIFKIQTLAIDSKNLILHTKHVPKLETRSVNLHFLCSLHFLRAKALL